MNRLFNRLLLGATDHRGIVVLLLLVLTAIALVGYINPSLITGLAETNAVPRPLPRLPQEEPAKTPQPPSNVSPIRLTNSDVVLVADSKQFFTPEGSRAIRHVVESLRGLPMVSEVFWLEDVPPINIFSLRNPIFPKGTATERQFEQARHKALENPLIRGQLLSDDAQTLLVMIKLDWLFVESDEQCTEAIRETAEKACADYPDVKMSFLITGHVPGYMEFSNSRNKNRVRYQVIGYGMILLMAVILFRGIRAVAIVTVAPVTGVFWTLGFLHLFDLHDNPFNDIILPVLISLVGFTDGVHLMVEIRRRRAAGEPPPVAARSALEKVGLACFLTSLTTGIGLGALAMAHHELVREFGWSCVIGVVLTFFAVVLIIPLLCSTPLGNRLHVGHGKGLVDRSLGKIAGVIDWVLRRKSQMTWIAIVSTAIMVAITSTLRPDEVVASALPVNSEVSRAISHLDKQMHGMESARIDVYWSEEVPSDSEEVLQVIGEAQAALQQEQLIGHPVSLKSFIDVLPGDPEATNRMSMTELLPPPLKRAFYTPEHRRAEVQFRVQDLGIATYGPVFERMQARLGQIHQDHPQFQLVLVGNAVGRWQNLYQIVVDLALSLGSASVVIFLVLTLAYQSIRLGLIAIVPNLFPLALTGTWLVATGHNLEVSMVCAFTVCLGIAVDDTIHFLTRYREELAGDTEEDAIRRAFVSTGTALIMTTVILTVGFSTVIMSGMREQRIFATMGCMTIGSALIGDLLFLPPMLAYFRKRK